MEDLQSNSSGSVVIKPAEKNLVFGIPVFLLGLVTVFVGVAATSDTIGLVMFVAGGLVFAGVGFYLVARTSLERYVIEPEGITKYGLPNGKVQFRCAWDKVFAYKRRSGSFGGQYGFTDYHVNELYSSSDFLEASSNLDFYPALHSHILSHLPEHIELRLARTETAGGKPVQSPARYRSDVPAGRVGAYLWYLFLLAIPTAMAVVVLGDIGMTVPTPLPVKVGVMAVLVTAIIGIGYVAAQRLGGTGAATYVLDRDGIVQILPNDTKKRIAWADMKAVEYLQMYDNGPNSNSINATAVGNRHVYYYAVIGTNGDYILFDSRMRDYHALIRALVDSAPKNAYIELHASLDSL